MLSQQAIAERYRDQIGQTIGGLTFVRLSATRGDGNRVRGVFMCACGNEIDLAVGRVLSGHRLHCGCRGNKTPGLTHGMRHSAEYASWMSMKDRCLNPHSKDYERWGAKGVTICPEWVTSFAAFYTHIGPRPSGTTLDRIDGRKGYEPDNIRWATRQQQQRNRVTAYVWMIKGQRFETHTEAADHFGVSEHTVWRWVNGQMDKRRNRYTPPREDCYVVSRY